MYAFVLIKNLQKYCLVINNYIITFIQATTVISNALTNKNYEALEGLVTQEMIETLKVKIETLSPNQRQLIAVNEDDMLFYALSDIAATVGKGIVIIVIDIKLI